MAGEFSRRLGWLDEADVARLRRLLVRAGLPVDPPPLDPQRALELMRMDKKVRAGRIRLVLLKGIGQAVCTTDYEDEALAALLGDLFGKAGA
jgi:3-dehydroquinate synthetase